jgi:hypothetical protein
MKEREREGEDKAERGGARSIEEEGGTKNQESASEAAG